MATSRLTGCETLKGRRTSREDLVEPNTAFVRGEETTGADRDGSLRRTEARERMNLNAKVFRGRREPENPERVTKRGGGASEPNSWYGTRTVRL